MRQDIVKPMVTFPDRISNDDNLLDLRIGIDNWLGYDLRGLARVNAVRHASNSITRGWKVCGSKECPRAGVQLPVTEFSLRDNGQHAMSYCKKCECERVKRSRRNKK